ncbi:MAG: MEDS domain-containing protein [Solirubrobacterales bacterium]
MSGGFVHEAGLYAGDDELVALLVPFAQDAAAAGEPTVVALHARHAEVLRPALADTPGVTFAPVVHTRPASTIRTLLNLFETHAADGGGRLRIVGEIPDPAPATWEPWARYEAAANRLYADFSVWALCAYDTRTTPDDVLADVTRTHARIATADGAHRPNESYEPPEAFLTARRPPPPIRSSRRSPRSSSSIPPRRRPGTRWRTSPPGGRASRRRRSASSSTGSARRSPTPTCTAAAR